MSNRRTLEARIETWPLARAFKISRESKSEAVVVVVEISQGGVTGQGECVPYNRYNETPETVLTEIESMQSALETGLTREALQSDMAPGAARNAVDCALWDIEAKSANKRVWELADLPPLKPTKTLYTISLGTPEEMGTATRRSAFDHLKIKMGSDDAALETDRLQAVRDNAPKASLVVDANEGWSIPLLEKMIPVCVDLGIDLIEQPVPAKDDGPLADIKSPVRLLADEAFHDREHIDDVIGKYQAVNIKLDKTGGLTEAILLARAAKERDLALFIGCMVSTSLAMAPAFLLSPFAEFIDLDGPLLLARDRSPAIQFDGNLMHPPAAELWG